MSESVRLRHLAEINPATAAFDVLDADDLVTFMPLETVWADSRCEITRVRPKSEVSSGYVRFQAGDILSPKVTPTFQAGRSALLTEIPSTAGAASTEVHVVRANKGRADPRYLRYGLLSKPFLDEGVSRFQGVAGLQRVPEEFLSDFRVIERSLEEQRRIADFLDDQVARIDNIIAARGRQLALLYRLFGAELTAAVFGDGAPTIPLGYVALVEHGRQRSPENQSGPYMTPYVRSANVIDGLVDLSELLEMNFTPAEQNTYALRYGDVLVTEASGSVDAIGASARWTEYLARTVCFQNHLLRVRPRSGAADASFLYWWARASYHSGAMRVWATGANILNLGSEALRGMPVPRLTINQQASTGRRAELVAERYVTGREVLRRQLARLQELKRSLITAAVTGEFDVSTADGSQVPA